MGCLSLVEVSPRDGLQNETRTFSTAEKVELVNRAIDAGHRRIEATSFVSPKAVPRLADADELMASVPRDKGVSYSALIVNERGLARAISAQIDEINFVVVASESLSRRNQGSSTSDSLKVWEAVAAGAREAGIRTSVTIAAAFGCPFEGDISAGRVLDVAGEALRSAPDEIALADTIGVGTPQQVTRLFGRLRLLEPQIVMRAHFHDTRHTGVANAVAAAAAGVEVLDASIGGIGGCPFAPGATGNVATEDLLYLFGREGIDLGVDLTRTIEAVSWLEGLVGRRLPGGVSQVSQFPETLTPVVA